MNTKCISVTLRERHDISNHLRHEGLIKSLFTLISKKYQSLALLALCEGNPPVSGGFPHKGPVITGNIESVPMSWRLHRQSWDVQFTGSGSECHNIQYSPRNMHTVFALLCFVVVIHWLIFPYPPGLLRWHCGNLTIAPVPAKQTLMNMDKYFMWIHYERLHIHNKATHNKTVCIFIGIYCNSLTPCFLISVSAMIPGNGLHWKYSYFSLVWDPISMLSSF